MQLQDKVALVTGASRGLGAAITEALIAEGAHVFGFGRNQALLEVLNRRLGKRFHPMVVDVQQADAVEAAIQSVVAQSGGRIDVLINNAGLGKFGGIETMPESDWDVQVNTNLKGVFLCTRAVVPVMKQQNAALGFGGHIINVASVAGLAGRPDISIYNATKFGLRGFSESLMLELRNDGIKVTCIYPGSIETDFFRSTGFPSSSQQKMQPEDLAETVIHVLQTPDHYLISEVVMRPLRPGG